MAIQIATSRITKVVTALTRLHASRVRVWQGNGGPAAVVMAMKPEMAWQRASGNSAAHHNQAAVASKASAARPLEAA